MFVLQEKLFLNNPQSTYAGVSFQQSSRLSGLSGYCKIFKNTHFEEHLRTVAFAQIVSTTRTLNHTEAVVQRCSVKKVFLEFSQNSQENTCARVSFLIKVAGLRPATLLKERLQHRRFPVNFEKFLGTPYFIEHLWWLLLVISLELLSQ